MSNSNITLTERERLVVLAHTENGLPRLEHFTRNSGVKLTPRRLLGSVTRGAYLRMTEAERMTLIRERLLEQNIAEAIERKRARREEAEPIMSEAPDGRSANETTAPERKTAQHAAGGSSWLLPCACGCGAWLPAAGPRPRVAYRRGHLPPSKRRAPKSAQR